MSRRDLDALPGSDVDAGADIDDDHPGLLFDEADDRPRPAPSRRQGSRTETRREARRGTRRRHRRRVLSVMALLLVVVVAAAAYFIGVPAYHYFHPQDYSGSGSGSVVITVHPDDTATQIAQRLDAAGVIASTRAFTDAAGDDQRSTSIQPGSYRLHRHMSAKSALAALLDPASRLNADVVVTEGATSLDVAARLSAAPCTAASPRGTVCGLGLPAADVRRALSRVSALGLPTDFTVSGRTPSSVEGFLYPATYAFDETTSASAAVQQMVSRFTDAARTTGFASRADALGVTPYQALVIASIAQSEAKYPDDMAKVVRVILNRIAIARPLQIDAISLYACKLAGTATGDCRYDSVAGPYNSYRNAGLPPTPISNPGADAMTATAHPATGTWLYYVNGDAAGHLYFTSSESDFTAAVARCRANNWGCA